jgi:hypothetical protein
MLDLKEWYAEASLDELSDRHDGALEALRLPDNNWRGPSKLLDSEVSLTLDNKWRGLSKLLDSEVSLTLDNKWRGLSKLLDWLASEPDHSRLNELSDRPDGNLSDPLETLRPSPPRSSDLNLVPWERSCSSVEKLASRLDCAFESLRLPSPLPPVNLILWERKSLWLSELPSRLDFGFEYSDEWLL